VDFIPDFIPELKKQPELLNVLCNFCYILITSAHEFVNSLVSVNDCGKKKVVHKFPGQLFHQKKSNN
jgi:hypothetical protein